jgi:hypothetical protein
VLGGVYNHADTAYDEPDVLNESIDSGTSQHSVNSWLATAQHSGSSTHKATEAVQQSRATATIDNDTVCPVQQSAAEQLRNIDAQSKAASPQRSHNLTQQQQQQQQARQAFIEQRIGSDHISSSSSAVRSSHDAAAMHTLRASASSTRHRPATAGNVRYDITIDVALQHGASPQRSTVHARAVSSSSSGSDAVLVSPRQLRQTAASRIQAALAETGVKSSGSSASGSKLQHSASSSDQPISSYAVAAHREQLSAASAAVQSPVKHATAATDAAGANTTNISSGTVQYRAGVSPQRASPLLSPLLVMEDDEAFNTNDRDDRYCCCYIHTMNIACQFLSQVACKTEQ